MLVDARLEAGLFARGGLGHHHRFCGRERCVSDSDTPPVAIGFSRPVAHAGLRIRLRSRLNPARPYIWRLSALMRVMAPSTGPELYGRVSPAATAARSV